MRRALLLLLLAACGADVTPRVRVEGRSVWIEGETPLRGLQLELAWDQGLHITGIEAGADVARLDLVRAQIAGDGRSARVILTDTRRVALPARGELVHVVGSGEGTLRVTGVRLVEASR